MFEEIEKYHRKYNSVPSYAAIEIAIEARGDLDEATAKNVGGVISKMKADTEEHRLQWLLDETEKFCQDEAIHNAIKSSILILRGDDKKKDKGSIPVLLKDALSVCFNPNLGHDYTQDIEAAYEAYTRVENKIPFDIDFLNDITDGGMAKKTLMLFVAGTGVGKSMMLCHLAADILSKNYNVLYITMEMSELEIRKRIDANLMEVPSVQFKNMSRDMFYRKAKLISNSTKGKLIIQEYPNGAAHSGHFRALINDLQMKKNFKPDVLIVDYLGICASARIKSNTQGAQRHEYLKVIAEEIRGLGQEFDIPVLSATQFNRTGHGGDDPEITDTGESFGIPQTADYMVGMISSELMETNKQIMLKQLKNRYNDGNTNKRCIIGVERSMSKFFNLNNDPINKAMEVIKSGTTATGGVNLSKFKTT